MNIVFYFKTLSSKRFTITASIGTATYDSLEYSEKIRLDISRESSARQRIHVKNQAVFSSKDKRKKIKVSSAAILLGSLRVNYVQHNKASPALLIRHNQLLQLCMASTAWSDSVIRSASARFGN